MKHFFLLSVFSVCSCLVGGGEVLPSTQKVEPSSLSSEDLREISRIEAKYEAERQGAVAGSADDKLTKNKKRSLADGQEPVAKKPCLVWSQAFFTKQGEKPIEEALRGFIGQAKVIKGAAYVFANMAIASAMVHQVRQGAVAKVMVDSRYEEYKSTRCLNYLVNNGVTVIVAPPYTDKQKKMMHHKFLLFEDAEGKKILWNGSYNLSYQANKNNENVVVTNDPNLVDLFERELEELFVTGKPFVKQITPRGSLLDPAT